jgi:hypothetical protein
MEADVEREIAGAMSSLISTSPAETKAWVELGVAAVGAFFGTVAGALIALFGDGWRRAKETAERNITAANLAIFQLGQMYDLLPQYKRDAVDPNRDSPLRWLLIARVKFRRVRSISILVRSRFSSRATTQLWSVRCQLRRKDLRLPSCTWTTQRQRSKKFGLGWRNEES